MSLRRGGGEEGNTLGLVISLRGEGRRRSSLGFVISLRGGGEGRRELSWPRYLIKKRKRGGGSSLGFVMILKRRGEGGGSSLDLVMTLRGGRRRRELSRPRYGS